MKKKILIGTMLMMLLSFFNPNLVEASTRFYEGEHIPNLWIKKEKNGRIRYQQALFLRRSGDNQFAYCIEPWSSISDNVDYTEEIDVNSIDDETLEKIALYAYYGYQYGTHQESKWYYITQVLIWQEIDHEASFYFTDSLNGNKITSYDQNIQEIKDLVEHHLKEPNFQIDKIELLLGSTQTITDDNQVLDNYKIASTQEHVTYQKIGNQIIMTPTSLGESHLVLEKKDAFYQHPPIVYRSKDYQDFLVVGSFKKMNITLPITIKGGTIEIEKVDADSKLPIPKGEASLLGSVFEIYNSNQELIKEVTLTDKTNITISNLEAGTYTIKEKSAGVGYNKNWEEITVTIDPSHITQKVTFENKVIENSITIKKHYGYFTWEKEEGAVFELYNQKNELIKTLTTDQEGIIETTLPYGTYTLKQIKGKENYAYLEEDTITVHIDSVHQILEYYDSEKRGSAIVQKLDIKENALIKDNPATFWLIQKDTMKILGTYKTNGEGTCRIDDLSYGTYLLKEIASPVGYLLQEEIVEFTIDDDHRQIDLKVYNEKQIEPPKTEHIIEVPNTSIIQIEKEEVCDDIKKRYLFTPYYASYQY